MSLTAQRFPSRRRILLGLGLLTQIAAAPKPPGKPQIVTVLGELDHGGPGPAGARRHAGPAAGGAGQAGGLGRGPAAGVSGDTSGGGLARVGFSVAADTRVCVVALGGNDLLQGVEPAQTRANLRGVLQKLKSRGVGAVLVGVGAPPTIGASYAREFNAIYPSLAREFGVPLYANILAGVGGNAALLQRDGVHPNAAGARKIGEALAPIVARALKGRPRIRH
ncbi:GDSL-type esterase/lipase family protein [Caulobacter sp. UC70_42]|uniref:GDSL-type esterase/lipase family protein n=1 Tax=Caulobacter sp. UC70_42 TaxID=3374551 RepID=UPI003756C1F6